MPLALYALTVGGFGIGAAFNSGDAIGARPSGLVIDHRPGHAFVPSAGARH